MRAALLRQRIGGAGMSRVPKVPAIKGAAFVPTRAMAVAGRAGKGPAVRLWAGGSVRRCGVAAQTWIGLHGPESRRNALSAAPTLKQRRCASGWPLLAS